MNPSISPPFPAFGDNQLRGTDIIPETGYLSGEEFGDIERSPRRCNRAAANQFFHTGCFTAEIRGEALNGGDGPASIGNHYRFTLPHFFKDGAQ